MLVEREIGYQPFEPGILLFHLPQPTQFAHAQVRVPGQALDRILNEGPSPRSITVDHGTEFQSRALEEWVDWYSGGAGGWSMSSRQDRQLVVQAMLMAVWQRSGRTPVILHSDRGCQFTSEEYQQFLAAHHIICSMSAVGSCADNAAAESFFGVLKRERVNRRQYRTRAEARVESLTTSTAGTIPGSAGDWRCGNGGRNS